MSATKKADDKETRAADVPTGPGVATTADISGPGGPGTALGEAGAQEPVETLTRPMTSGTPEAWAIPLTPDHKADRQAALKHAEKQLKQMAARGHLPPALAVQPGAGEREQTRRERVVKARAKVQDLNARHPAAEMATALRQAPELPPPPAARAAVQHSMTREEMQANGITDDVLANADGLGVDRIALCEDPKLVEAVQEYIDAVRDGV